ncbi:MAG TPA: signal peptidase I [Spirochaetia bacterium]|nr:signal peptidase I [Spirochaetia bacterium]
MALSSISSTDNIYYFRHRSRRRFFALVRFLIVFYIVYQIVTVMLISSYTIGSGSMRPVLRPGDRVLVCPLVFGSPVPFTQLRLPAVRPPKRGDIVIVRPAYYRPDPWYAAIAGPVIRFFSVQHASLGSDSRGEPGNSAVAARVVGLPGDTVRVQDDVVYVEPKGTASFSSELELSRKPYDPSRPSLPEGWNGNLPFSGRVPDVTLGPHSYFLVGDNRAASNDSIEWGPVSEGNIVGKVIFRYWPLNVLNVL